MTSLQHWSAVAQWTILMVYQLLLLLVAVTWVVGEEVGCPWSGVSWQPIVCAQCVCVVCGFQIRVRGREGERGGAGGEREREREREREIAYRC